MVSIPPDREQAVVLATRPECPVDLVLALIDDDLSRPVLVFGDPGKVLCLRTGGGEDVERVGIPESASSRGSLPPLMMSGTSSSPRR